MLEPTGFVPDEPYRTWFAQVESCSGRRGNFDGIEWSVREEPKIGRDGKPVVGHIDFPNRIWLARAYLEHEGIVKHEMLHYLLQHGGHPAPPFGVCTGGY